MSDDLYVSDFYSFRDTPSDADEVNVGAFANRSLIVVVQSVDAPTERIARIVVWDDPEAGRLRAAFLDIDARPLGRAPKYRRRRAARKTEKAK